MLHWRQTLNSGISHCICREMGGNTSFTLSKVSMREVRDWILCVALLHGEAE